MFNARYKVAPWFSAPSDVILTTTICFTETLVQPNHNGEKGGGLQFQFQSQLVKMAMGEVLSCIFGLRIENSTAKLQKKKRKEKQGKNHHEATIRTFHATF